MFSRRQEHEASGLLRQTSDDETNRVLSRESRAEALDYDEESRFLLLPRTQRKKKKKKKEEERRKKKKKKK